MEEEGNWAKGKMAKMEKLIKETEETGGMEEMGEREKMVRKGEKEG